MELFIILIVSWWKRRTSSTPVFFPSRYSEGWRMQQSLSPENAAREPAPVCASQLLLCGHSAGEETNNHLCSTPGLKATSRTRTKPLTPCLDLSTRTKEAIQRDEFVSFSQLVTELATGSPALISRTADTTIDEPGDPVSLVHSSDTGSISLVRSSTSTKPHLTALLSWLLAWTV